MSRSIYSESRRARRSSNQPEVRLDVCGLSVEVIDTDSETPIDSFTAEDTKQLSRLIRELKVEYRTAGYHVAAVRSM